ncbi:MAG: maleylpyruvate isomerase N-terminal domain-containing protein, partial [Nocardiopsaceae bacterium]|nr:maleylpyruvate isomerase N-terminal domain-containing protein [Nocardiopsaceae bacterium]
MNGAGTRDGRSRAPQPASDVLERALRYALRMTEPVTAELLALPTPCRGWDLRTLLLHAADSVSALAEGFDTGCIGLSEPGSYGPVTVVEAAADPAREFRLPAEGLLGM